MASTDGSDALISASLTSSQPPIPNIHTLDNTGYCVLSLDGGGVRGLSTLYILRGIMNRLNDERDKNDLKPKKPCDIFDLIGGTSTGGLIAIMLGHLEMDVDECITAYVTMMKHVFEKKKNNSFVSFLGGVKPQFSSKALATAISTILGERANEKFENGTRPRCKVFVCTKFQKTNTITRLRNYRLASGSEHHPTILEAALATSAAPTYFSDVAIEGSKFVDGAIGANNPALQIEEEARDLWCEETGHLHPLVKCFISIGTGHPGIRSVSDKGMRHLLETLKKEATETEATNQIFLSNWRGHVDENRCFRFNVKHGLEDVSMAEYKQQSHIKETTSTYLDDRSTRVDVRKCVENLRMKEYEPTAAFVATLQEHEAVRSAQSASNTVTRATPSEIAELISLGNSHLKRPSNQLTKSDLLQARHYYSKALHYRKSNFSTSPKDVARLCQKLMETSLSLSMLCREATERNEFADQAREYGETALENVRKCEDDCMAAQVDFLLACVVVWKSYLQSRMSGGVMSRSSRREEMEILMDERLTALRSFPHLKMEVYEGQARKYLRCLDTSSVSSMRSF